MRRIAVTSDVLRSVGYEGGRLEVEFTSGAVYAYEGVQEDAFDRLMQAESHGQYFNAHIRGRYPFQRVS